MPGITSIAGGDLGKMSLIFLISFATIFLSRYSRLYNESAITAESETVLYLEESTGLEGLMAKLSELEVRFDKTELQWASSLMGWRTFNSGRYEIGSAESYDGLLSRIALGLQDHARVTILSGVNVERLAASLGRQLRADSTEFAVLFADTSSLVDELNRSPSILFSRMLPDTYNIYWTSSPEAVIKRIYNEFNRAVVNQLSDRIEASPLSLDEIITLASIVEWEARHGHEKPRVSGLYWNRLNRNMRLQADPTVIYALGEHRRLLYEDYQLNHPYNTYVHNGLPPGPITNPDIASIESVLNPEEHDYLFMVATPDGNHTFTRTYEEHRVASAEWRTWIQEQYRIRDQRERDMLLESEGLP